MSLKQIKEIQPTTKTHIGLCKSHGKFTGLKTLVNGNWVGGKCSSCQANQEQKSNKQMLKPLSKRFKECSFDNYILDGNKQQKSTFEACQRYADNFTDRFKVGGGLILYGTCGTGKTHLACAIANHVVGKNIADCLYSKVYDLFDDIKATWGGQGSTSQVLKSYTKPDLLIIDEIGIQYGSDAEKIMLFRILDSRNENYKPTIIISNLDESGLNQYLGERVVDRMYDGNGGKIGFNWDSHRRIRTQ